MHTYVWYIHTHTPAYNHTHIPTFTHTCTQAYIHTNILTHTHTHTYIRHLLARVRARALSLSPHLTNETRWQGEIGLFTVGAPATAKNIISVGAHLNARQSVLDVLTGENVFLGLKFSEEREQAMQALAAWASNFGSKDAISGTLVLASPLKACTSVAESLVRGKVALVQVLFFFSREIMTRERREIMMKR